MIFVLVSTEPNLETMVKGIFPDSRYYKLNNYVVALSVKNMTTTEIQKKFSVVDSEYQLVIVMLEYYSGYFKTDFWEWCKIEKKESLL